MAMSATLVAVGNPIANQPITFVLTVSNSSGGVVNVTGVQPKVLPLGVPMNFSPIFAPPGVSVASTTGGINALKVAVGASGTAVFTFQGVMFTGSMQTGQPSQASTSITVGADIVSDDGSVFSPGPINLAPAQPQPGPVDPEPFGPNTFGALQFNTGVNSALTL